MAWSRAEIAAHVDGLAQAHEGDAFVQEVARFADDTLDPAERPLLQEVLLERAAEEEDFRKAIRRRFAEKGWMRRTLDRVETVARGGGAARHAQALAAALEEGGPEGPELATGVERLRADRGRAALVLDELSRHSSAEVRAWVPQAARELLGSGGTRLLLGMTRDADPAVRDAAVDELVALDPEAARKVVPDLRRRLHSASAHERVTAMWTLAELDDRRSLEIVAGLAEGSEHAFERRAAEAVTLLLGDGRAEIVRRLRAHDHELVPALAAAARIAGDEEARAALGECARSAPDEACREACRAELARLDG
jgi:hypothetical protein